MARIEELIKPFAGSGRVRYVDRTIEEDIAQKSIDFKYIRLPS